MSNEFEPANRFVASMYQENRNLLFGIAYRMLGCAEDARDAVQDTFLSFQQIPRNAIEKPRALLISIVTRRSIDRLRSAKNAREVYAGPWLPEPILIDRSQDPSLLFEGQETLSTAFLLMLERLTPVERAVFLLRDVFDMDYEEIAGMLKRSIASCRKLNERARKRVREEKRTTQLPIKHKEQLLERFLLACRGRNLEDLISLLCEDVVVYSDGGGQISSALNPIFGPRKCARLFLGLINRYAAAGSRTSARLVDVNGEPAIVFYLDGKLDSVISMDFNNLQIVRIYAVRNPHKLQFLKAQLEQCNPWVWFAGTRRKFRLFVRVFARSLRIVRFS